MSNDAPNVVPMVSRAGRLSDALTRARAREQSRARDALAVGEGQLQALADELRSMADELPDGEAGRFDLVAATSGDQIAIDGLSFVDVHPETGAYRLVRQRRDGPHIIAEHSDREAMADKVADYIADRIVEREGLVDARAAPVRSLPTNDSVAPNTETEAPRRSFWPGFWLFVLGGVCAATALFTYAWLTAGTVG
ncbi:MAG: hypothetical protein AB8B88_02360 [Devosiaceae bacterium]